MIYQVGDPDPTKGLKKLCCPEEKGNSRCTLDVGHEHPQHVAGDGSVVCAAWETVTVFEQYPLRAVEARAALDLVRDNSDTGLWRGILGCASAQMQQHTPDNYIFERTEDDSPPHCTWCTYDNRTVWAPCADYQRAREMVSAVLAWSLLRAGHRGCTAEEPNMNKVYAAIDAGSVEYSREDAEVSIEDLISQLQQAQADGVTHVLGLSGNYRGAQYVRLGSVSDFDDDV